MNDYHEMPPSTHRLELTGREQMTISGVEDVERFDESSIVMTTTAGVLVIHGGGICTSASCRWTAGSCMWMARVDSLAYEDGGRESGGGFLLPPVWLSLWATASPGSWCSSASPFCWARRQAWYMTCCGRSGGAGPAPPRRWTVYTACCWAGGLLLFALERGAGELRLYALVGLLGGAVLFFSLFADLLRPVWDFWVDTVAYLAYLLLIPWKFGEKILQKIGRRRKKSLLFCGKMLYIKTNWSQTVPKNGRCRAWQDGKRKNPSRPAPDRWFACCCCCCW